MQVSWHVKSSKYSVITMEDNRSLVSCNLEFIPQLSLKHDRCCDGNLPREHDQYNQVTSWYVCGLVHSTLDAKRSTAIYLLVTRISLYVVSPTHLTTPVVKMALDSKRLCFTG